MPLLYLASLEHEFVSDEAMVEVAELVGITPAQVQSVASFYTMYKRQPVGDYLISVCTSITCHLLGGNEVLEAVEDATQTVLLLLSNAGSQLDFVVIFTLCLL